MSIEIEGFTSKKLENNTFNKSIYLTILPTKDWLTKKEIIFRDEKVYILISELFKKNKIIVKLNYKNDNLIEYYIHKLLIDNKIPNIIKIYGIIKCLESKENIKILENQKTSKKIVNENKELFKDGYCNGTQNDKQINMTVMKKYKYLLSEIKLNFREVIECIFQIIITQLLLYKEYGILHNDMKNPGNIFIELNKKYIKYEYNVKNIRNIYIKPSKKIILFDFDRSEIIEPNFRLKYMKKPEIYLSERNILDNIIDSINVIFDQLYDTNPRKKILNLKKYLAQMIEDIRVIWKNHIMGFNGSLRMKIKCEDQRFKELVGEFTLKILSKLNEFQKEFKDKIMEIEKNNKNYDEFYLNGGYLIR
jgi:hypothetical protein